MTKEEGILTNPLETNHAWTNCFNGIPNFGFPDIYNYLVGECSYSQESLKSYKSRLGYKLAYCSLRNEIGRNEMERNEMGRNEMEICSSRNENL